MNDINEILEAIKIGDNDKLLQIITDNPSITDIKTEQGISSFQFAVYCRNKSAIEILRNFKKELDIYEAASVADTDIIIKLINENQKLINSFSTDGFTPLGLASYFGHIEIVKLLLNKGADPNIASNNQFNVAPIHSACAISNYDITDILIKNGANVNSKQRQGITPLHAAAHNGQTKLAKLLIHSGADVNAKTDDGQTPLCIAEEKSFNETAELIKQFAL